MASVYILYSSKLSKFYIGSCNDLEKRLADHVNKTHVGSFTSVVDDWELYFTIDNLEYSTARNIETHIKQMKSKKYIQNLKSYPEITQKLISKFSI